MKYAVLIKVGCREDSSVYIRMKIRAAREVGVKVTHVQLPKEASGKGSVGARTRRDAEKAVMGETLK